MPSSPSFLELQWEYFSLLHRQIASKTDEVKAEKEFHFHLYPLYSNVSSSFTAPFYCEPWSEFKYEILEIANPHPQEFAVSICTTIVVIFVCDKTLKNYFPVTLVEQCYGYGINKCEKIFHGKFIFFVTLSDTK